MLDEPPLDGFVVDFSPYAQDFVEHYESVRGKVRLALLHEQVAKHVPAGRVLDVGGGAGHLARLLANEDRSVVVLEPSAEMRDRAHVVLAGAERVEVEAGDAGSIPRRTDAGSFDAVVCHAVAPYVDDLDDLISDIAAAARPGGVLSVVVKNRDALAMRPALEGRWSDVPDAVDAEGDAGGLGIVNKAHTVSDVFEAMHRAGCDVIEWYGIRVVSDVLAYESDANVEEVLEAERSLTNRDPYRSLGRLLHVVGVRRPEVSSQTL